MKPVWRLPYIERAHYVRVLHPRAEGSFAKKPGYCSLVVPELLAQHFHSNFAVLGMMRTVDSRRAALANAVEERITGQRCSDERVARHAGEANGRKEGSQAKKRDSSRVE
jgi:hypothetical protein